MKKTVIVAATEEIFDFIVRTKMKGEFRISRTGEELLSLVKELKPVAVVVDSDFDRGRGKEIVQKLAKSERTLTIILLTPHGSNVHPEGENIHILEKPFSLDDIRVLLEEKGFKTQEDTDEIIDLAPYVKGEKGISEGNEVRKKVKEIADLLNDYSDVFGAPEPEARPSEKDIELLKKELMDKLERFIEATVERKLKEQLEKNQD